MSRISQRLKRLSALLEDLNRPQEATWMQGFEGTWQHHLELIKTANQENAALRRRVALLSNACEAAVNQLQAESGIDPNREICLKVLQEVLDAPEKPEGGEEHDDFLNGYEEDADKDE